MKGNNSFYEAGATLTQKPDKNITQEKITKKKRKEKKPTE